MRCPGERIPAAVVTGFLGSGKTTMLNRLLRDPGMMGALVVINEFGEIGLDHELIEHASGEVLLLKSGCLCCSMRSDLVDTLENSIRRVQCGEIPGFDRVIIETTGIADPQPIMQAFMCDPFLAQTFDLRTVTATVDAVLGLATLERHWEAAKQIALADHLLVTKIDLLDGAPDVVVRSLRHLNPRAQVHCTTRDTHVDPARFWQPLFEAALLLDRDAPLLSATWPVAGPAPLPSGRQNAASRHAATNINTFSMFIEGPSDPGVLDDWLTALLKTRGADVLRFKALVNVEGIPGPLVLHGVQHFLHPPVVLKAWPCADRRTRMIFVTNGLSVDDIQMPSVLSSNISSDQCR